MTIFLIGLAIGAVVVGFFAKESAYHAWRQGYEQAYRDGMKFRRITERKE